MFALHNGAIEIPIIRHNQVGSSIMENIYNPFCHFHADLNNIAFRSRQKIRITSIILAQRFLMYSKCRPCLRTYIGNVDKRLM